MIELNVCIGSACHIRGSYNVIQTFQQMIEKYKVNDKIDLKSSFCMKECDKKGVAVSVNGKIFSIQPEQSKIFFKEEILPLI